MWVMPEILLFLSMVKYKVCVSSHLFEVLLVVYGSSQDLRDVVLFMQGCIPRAAVLYAVE